MMWTYDTKTETLTGISHEEWQKRIEKRDKDHESAKKKAQKIVRKLSEQERWALKQELAEPSFYYGNGGTIHGTNHLDIVTNAIGTVTEVWFRCTQLPFQQTKKLGPFERETIEMIEGLSKITGIEIER